MGERMVKEKNMVCLWCRTEKRENTLPIQAEGMKMYGVSNLIDITFAVLNVGMWAQSGRALSYGSVGPDQR
jgi:hypothetical protein